MAIKIWHNNRCSKSRDALKLLKDQGMEIEIYNYLQESPSVDDIKDVLNKLGIKAKDLIRTKETLFNELGLKTIEDEETLIKAMAENPKLIERPIIITDTKAIIGRPPELVLAL
ncbi:MAG TPA: arsenate reductase (glutaredoxin) [Sulfuricurvum sp.]|nr:MAG: arsenate reductase (glutaredoxin) [Campylobacterales bacterium 16-40-21]OZA02080.1 MAG: arsenate reductase (glutaredoxin) [Sulfuricurvum sp. 17-40-25]HQS67539.1 arsenate reductase (glutaredoxin) [Sulfuricurvum sp.]HQT37104.1 arsenate reductase (glutaredoxin) [Sulfuricurvum sp.]